MKGQPFARDCLKVAEQTIIESNLLDPNALAEWRKDTVAQVDDAVATAPKDAVPEADKEDWCALSTRDLVYHVAECELRTSSTCSVTPLQRQTGIPINY